MARSAFSDTFSYPLELSSNLTSENRIKPVIPGSCQGLSLLKAKIETIKGKQEVKRARKPNFSSADYTLLLTLAEENLDTIRLESTQFNSNATGDEPGHG